MRLLAFTEQGLDMAGPAAPGRGLDVACGPGHTTAALAARTGEALGVDFAPAMVERAAERFAARPGVSFAVDDAEALAQPDAAFDVVSCSFGLMYCYDARSAMAEMARVLRPGGRLVQVVWGRAPEVWWVPVIELIETRAEYYATICPLMFFYGLPGVLERMMQEAGLTVAACETLPGRMSFASVDEAVAAAIHAGPLAGLFENRLAPDQQDEVRAALRAHIDGIAEPDPAGVSLPAQVAVGVGERPTA
jgi:ubiquinone/menaquinone biosynthesis C-methylase UbiE